MDNQLTSYGMFFFLKKKRLWYISKLKFFFLMSNATGINYFTIFLQNVDVVNLLLVFI